MSQDLDLPPASWTEEAPPTEPRAALPPSDPPSGEGLDLVILSLARRAIGDAERHTAGQLHGLAVLRARDALRALALVLATYDRKASVVEHLTRGAAE